MKDLFLKVWAKNMGAHYTRQNKVCLSGLERERGRNKEQEGAGGKHKEKRKILCNHYYMQKSKVFIHSPSQSAPLAY